MSLTVEPVNGGRFTFGRITETHIVVKNDSTEAIIVSGIIPSLNVGEEPVLLSGSVYGDIGKAVDGDAYWFDRLVQRASALPFHAGLLLPGERVVVCCPYRPVARIEQFEIHYYSTGRPYDGTLASLKPFRIYMPASSDEYHSGQTVKYVPFSKSKWIELSSACEAVHPLGPDNSPRAGLIPNMGGTAQTMSYPVEVEYQGTPFCLEDAKKAASGIISVPPGQITAAYCEAFQGYVIFEDDFAWLLSSLEQDSRGPLFAAFPPIMLKDLDSSGLLCVRVGEKQGGFGPSHSESDRIFWGLYPVYYGDDMYTRGEFIDLEKDHVLPFLAEARKQGVIVGSQNYFFRSRYYTLAVQAGYPVP